MTDVYYKSRFIPESPRWLSSQGRLTETYRILKQMARVNGRELPASDDQTLVQSLELQPEVGVNGFYCTHAVSDLLKPFYSRIIAENKKNTIYL